jgi:hypothetical protein
MPLEPPYFHNSGPFSGMKEKLTLHIPSFHGAGPTWFGTKERQLDLPLRKLELNILSPAFFGNVVECLFLCFGLSANLSGSEPPYQMRDEDSAFDENA